MAVPITNLAPGDILADIGLPAALRAVAPEGYRGLEQLIFMGAELAALARLRL